MRLWHEALLPYLPRQQLLGRYRECCALRGNGWGKKHATVNYVFEHSYGELLAYHSKVMCEMQVRGYTPDKKWASIYYRGKNCDPYPKSKKSEIDYGFFKGLCRSPYIYPEHDNAYLQECLENLENKGIHIDLEVM